MGVVGLTSLISENPHLLSKVQVGAVKLVIDGTNICHQLFYDGKIDARFGGDYANFETLCLAFFGALSKCSITPVIILDGNDESKLDTVLARQRSRIDMAKALANGARGKLLPLLAYDVFITAGKTLGAEFIQCVGEADNFIALVANALKCPVLSRDSDFYIFDLSHGYISFDQFDWQNVLQVIVDGTSQFRISAELYLVDSLLACFPDVSRELLPLFASLVGNDFCETENFSNFFANISKPKVSKRRSLRITKKHCVMLGVLAFLQDRSIDDAIDAVLTHIKLDKRDKLRTLLESSMSMYAANDLSSLPLSISDCRAYQRRLLLSTGDISDWFIDAYINSELPPAFLYIYRHRRCILPTIVEDLSKPSVFSAATDLRQTLYRLLIGADDALVYEYVREGANLRKVGVSPAPVDSVDSRLMSTTLDVSVRRTFLLSTVQAGDFSLLELPNEQQLFALTTFAWLRRCAPSAAELLALLINRARHFCTCAGECVHPDTVKTRFDNSPIEFSSLSISKLHRRAKGKGKQLIDVPRIHMFASWQTLWQSIGWLNLALRAPFSHEQSARVFSGRVLYNLVEELARVRTTKEMVVQAEKLLAPDCAVPGRLAVFGGLRAALLPFCGT